MNICVISDTHLQNDFSLIPTKAISLIKHSDLLIHCGDIVTENSYSFFKKLNKYLVAVQGNWDYDLSFLPLKELLQVEGLKVGVTHGHLNPNNHTRFGTEQRTIAMFQPVKPEIILFGHTHHITDKQYGNTRLLNPGSLVEGKRSLLQLKVEKAVFEVNFERFD